MMEEEPNADVEVFDVNAPLLPLPYCSDECVNGFCHDGECICIVGYEKDSNGTCQPTCSMGCRNGKCVEPEICECHNGFKPSSRSFDCVPICEAGCAICIEPFTCLVKYLPKIMTSTASPFPTSGTTKPQSTSATTVPLTLAPLPIFTAPTIKPEPKEDSLIIPNEETTKNCEMKKFLDEQNITKDRKLQNIKFVQFWQFDFTD